MQFLYTEDANFALFGWERIKMPIWKMNTVKCVKKKENGEKWFPNMLNYNISYPFFTQTLQTKFCILGSTALHLAADRGHLETLKWLVEKEADVKVKNKYGECVKKKNREKWFPNKDERSTVIYHTLSLHRHCKLCFVF